MPNTTIEEGLRIARQDLLDLGTRNRLVSTPRRSKSSSIEILDELADQVWTRIVIDGKPMTFLPLHDGEYEETVDLDEAALDLSQPGDESSDEIAERHTDDKLQTRLASKTLQGRLLKLFYDARTLEEEQGVNILFLAMGFLKWFEAESSSQPRYAPLLLVPVRLERQTAGSKFKLVGLDEEITTNLSLQAKLKLEFNIELPEVPEQVDFLPSDYFTQVRAAIAGQQRWEVIENEMVLWFYSFTKFLMYRDLDPKTWPEAGNICEQPNIGSIFDGGFRQERPIIDDDDKLDGVLEPANLCHVIDADSSQSVVIEEVRRGQHLVVQGPPGTGKSQTITNMIAAAVKEGKKVLFVAEKMAALEVVKSRMDKVGLGAACLELHSHKANKKAVLDDIKRTLACSRPRLAGLAEQVEELRRHRDNLNNHVHSLHTPLDPVGVTAYQAIGELVRLASAGVEPAPFQLEDPLTWTKEQFKAKHQMAQDAAAQVTKLGNPRLHPWRGVQLAAALPADLQRMAQQCTGLIPRLQRVIEAADTLADVLALPRPTSPREVSGLAVIASQLLKAPPLDQTAITSPVWDQQNGSIQALIEAGSMFATVRHELAATVEEPAWRIDLGAARKEILLRGSSWFRWLWKSYRQAIAVLEQLCRERPPTSQAHRLALLDRLIAGQQALRAVETSDTLGRQAFGALWNGLESNWEQLRAIAVWVGETSKTKGMSVCRELLPRLSDKKRCSTLLQELARDFKPCLTDTQQVFQSVQLNLPEAFATNDLHTIPLAAIVERLTNWLRFSEGIHDWIACRLRLERLRKEGLLAFAAALGSGELVPAKAADQFTLAWHEAVTRECYRQFPSLAEFSGQSHEAIREEFKRLDKSRIGLARKEVAIIHYQGIPRSEDLGEMAKLANELQKKTRHWPIRKLLREAGHAIQAIKPVFMMSPTSIAQFLEPGVLEFDLLLIDEASQVRPVEALGAMARCKQIVVVGDDKQMPPTAFFSNVMSDSDDDSDDDASSTRDKESILGLCLARNMRPRMLSWHYRSLHQSLIAVSNYEFYDNRLYVIPNPEPQMEDLGLRFHYLADGVFDRGGSATNPIEARHIAQAVMEHARRFPELSLGVGAFSMKQRDAILKELELLRRQNSSLESFFSASGGEPFFVKNLENLQGDERDVIFISVGYGPDKNRFFAMAFGPLSLEGGERRLNVLISRARRRCEVFSSLRAEDIDLTRAKSRGAAALKRFLKYAETGLLDAETQTDRDHDSVFEEEVAKAIRSHGYEVVPQVGVAGFFVDLAVKDPEKPGRYLLGVECDGATYHSARWARDRDRLRQDVLESRGWRIHRIWSTDWFRQPEEQMRKLLAALDLARLPPVPPDSVLSSSECDDEEDSDFHRLPNNDFEADESHDDPIPSVQYQEAELVHLKVDTSRPIHEANSAALAEVAVNVIQVEGPIHREEVARRVAAFWGAQRTTKKMIAAVDVALQFAQERGTIVVHSDFFTAAGQNSVPIRNREFATSTLRQPDMLPPAEICEALLQVVGKHVGVSAEEAVVATGRLLGFRSNGQQIKRVIMRELDRLLAENALRERDAKLFVERITAEACQPS